MQSSQRFIGGGPRLTALMLVLAATVPTIAGCEEDPERAAVVTAFEDTVSALSSGDWERMWALSSANAQHDITQLHARLQTALALVDQVYPESTRAEARLALGEELVRDITGTPDEVGPQMLSRLMDGSSVAHTEGATDGRNASSVTIDGATAIVHTSAGEVYGFDRSETGWTSRLASELMTDDHRIANLKEAAEAVIEARRLQQEAWLASRDPATAHGAYNLARGAVSASPMDGRTLYALLDPEARKALVEALETAREAQRSIQRRMKRAQRKAAYDKHGLTPYVDVESDRELYLAWVATKEFVPPLEETSAPESVKAGADETHASVLTASGKAVDMVLVKGVWRLAKGAESIEKGLLAPAKAALTELTQR